MNNKGVDYSKKFTKQELDLLQEYDQLRRDLRYKNIKKAFWKPVRDASGVIPPTMEGATIGSHDDKLYMYGGFGTTVYNEIRRYDIHKKVWTNITPKNDIYDIPMERFGHSMIRFRDFFFIFGGAGISNPSPL